MVDRRPPDCPPAVRAERRRDRRHPCRRGFALSLALVRAPDRGPLHAASGGHAEGSCHCRRTDRSRRSGLAAQRRANGRMVLFRGLRSGLESAGDARSLIDRRAGHQPQSRRLDAADQRGPRLLHGHGPHHRKLFRALLPPPRRTGSRLGAETEMSDKKPVHPDTKLVEGGRRKEWLRGMVNVPVSRTSTVLFESIEQMHAGYPPEDGRLSYGRNGTCTQWSLAEALTELEPGAAGTRLFPSGSAAVSIALTSVLSPGDELLMVDSAYGPTRLFCDRELKRLGISTRYYDPIATPEDLAELLPDKTRA